jgi:hypothetical protein
MFSLNLYGTFVLTMSKKSYFIKLGSPLQTALKAVSLTLQHPLEKTHVLASSSASFTNNNGSQTLCFYYHKDDLKKLYKSECESVLPF